jgi:hypothetical protein
MYFNVRTEWHTTVDNSRTVNSFYQYTLELTVNIMYTQVQQWDKGMCYTNSAE